MTVENPKLAVYGLKLSEGIEGICGLAPFPFLILKRRPLKVIHADADAHPKRRRGGGVGNFVRASKGPDLI